MSYDPGLWAGQHALLSESYAQELERVIRARHSDQTEVFLDYVFNVNNHLQARRLATFLRETSNSPANIIDVTTLDDPADSFRITGTIRLTSPSLDLLLALFRWLRRAELRHNARLAVLSV